jgi:rubrerythrin
MKKSSNGDSRNSSSSRSTAGRSSGSRSKGKGSASLNSEWLHNFLSEMLAVERGGVQLYEKALEELAHDELRTKLKQFHEQTERHVELCEELLSASGADENSASPGAQAAEHKAQGLISAEVPEEMADLNNIENLVLAETKDHWNWEMLGSLMDEIGDRDLKKAVSRAVREVRKQEGDHVAWNQKTLTKLATEAAHQAQDAEETEEPEEDEMYDE